MTEEQVVDILKGHRFRFGLDGFEQYLAESRKIAERILKRTEVNMDKGIQTVKEHLSEVAEPQYRSVLLMRLF